MREGYVSRDPEKKRALVQGLIVFKKKIWLLESHGAATASQAQVVNSPPHYRLRFVYPIRISDARVHPMCDARIHPIMSPLTSRSWWEALPISSGS